MYSIRQKDVRNTVVNHGPVLRPVFNALPPLTDSTASPGQCSFAFCRVHEHIRFNSERNMGSSFPYDGDHHERAGE